MSEQIYIHPTKGTIISRQRWWQLENRRRGLCERCSAKAAKGRPLCNRHLEMAKKARRAQGEGARPHLYKENRIDFSKADWSKTNKEVAKQVGCTWLQATCYRVNHGMPPSPVGRGRPRIPDKKWAKVNWKQPTWLIAQKLGVCLMTVHSYRKAHGILPHRKWYNGKIIRTHIDNPPSQV